MGKYVANNLSRNEKIVYEAKKHPVALLWIGNWIPFFTSELAVTNKNVIGKIGLIRTASLSSPLNKVQNVGVSSGLLGKIFKYGTVSIETAGSKAVSFGCIKNPEQFKKTLTAQPFPAPEGYCHVGTKKFGSSVSLGGKRKDRSSERSFRLNFGIDYSHSMVAGGFVVMS